MLGWFSGLHISFQVIAIIALFASIGGSIYAGYKYIENKDQEIVLLEQNIQTLKDNNTKIMASNVSITSENVNLNNQLIQNQQQLDQALQIINASQSRINANNQHLFDPVQKQKQLENNIANPSKALDDSNKQETCFWQHYNDLDGHCQDGTFIKD